jgi:hypothetical protein
MAHLEVTRGRTPLGRWPAVAAIMLASLTVAGCSGNSTADGTGTSSGVTRKPSPTPTAGSYTLTELVKEPCRALDSHDDTALGLHDNGDRDGTASCDWNIRADSLVGFRTYPTSNDAEGIAVGIRVEHHHVLPLDVQTAKAGRERHGHVLGHPLHEGVDLVFGHTEILPGAHRRRGAARGPRPGEPKRQQH